MRDMMAETTKHLMNCGFNIVFGYTQSDEISLLFHPELVHLTESCGNTIQYSRAKQARNFLFYWRYGAFDCRISELPTVNLACDYFRWRNEDAHRNALNSHVTGFCEDRKSQ
jgi:tRNA(His) 5'-end guanylyltransferase